MPKNTPSIEEEAENVKLNTFEEDVADAGAESPDEGHDTTKLALKPKKSRKNRSPAQIAAFEKMRAAKQQKDEAKRAASKAHVVTAYSCTRVSVTIAVQDLMMHPKQRTPQKALPRSRERERRESLHSHPT